MTLQPLAQNTAIPAEIWMHVAQFIPHSDLCSMLSINRVFFQLSMDARYRELTFGFDSDAKALWRLKRAREPSISHRVRSLYINLAREKDIYGRFYGELTPAVWTGKATREGMQIMAETVIFLINITEFSLDWEPSFPRELHPAPLLIAAWKSFGHGLRKLSFLVSLYNLAALLSAADGLVSLRDLDVKVSEYKHPSAPGEALATVLAPFVNKVAPTLHSLSFCSRLYGLDFPPFFDEFSKIPTLEKLCVRAIDGLQPPSVARFIYNHAATLCRLEWDQSYDLSPIQDVTDWVGANNLEGAFLNLHTLRIQVPNNPSCFAMLVEHIILSANTLTSLGLLGYHMTYEQANILMSRFAPNGSRNLKELGFYVESLSPELILLLAQTVPHLEKLAIHALNVTGDETGKGITNSIYRVNHGNRKLEERLNARKFAHTMRTYDFSGWALCDIDIQGAFWERYLSEKLMRVLAECVPSVKTWCGKHPESYTYIDPDDRL